jgi:acyl-CoA reductase-like NAD-dependent aldehyde dehydrogenase
LEFEVLDRGYGLSQGAAVSYFREGRLLGAVLPSNSPGVHTLWLPAIPLKTPIVLKPGREEPWTPYRVIQAFLAAGAPKEAFGFYPTDHAGAAELLHSAPRSMIFGDVAAAKLRAHDPRVQIHGPGFSKIILGEDSADEWERHLDVMVSSITANGGRSCLNASSIWTPRHGRAIAEALGRRLASVRARPADDPEASLAAFAHPAVAEQISAVIDQGLRGGGATDWTETFRGAPRLTRIGRCAYLLPTIIHCEQPDHPLADREFLFPYASVVEIAGERMLDTVGPTLVASAITGDEPFIRELMACRHIDRLNIGPIPTGELRWDQPHEGNLFEHLYRRRALQMESAA